LALIPACRAGPSSDTGSALGSETMAQFLKQLTGRFDYVLLDLPPMAPLVDVRAVSPLLDKVLVVVEWANTDRGVLREALDRHGPVQGGKILGLALNKIPPSVLKQYPTYRMDTYLKEP
jgi:polysaccharide biosynthesis transport protein